MNTLQSKYLPKERLETLTDGIYTVALTLLATSLGLPDAPLTDTQFHQELLEQWPKILTWLSSAILIIINWMSFVRVSNFLNCMPKVMLFFGLVECLLITLLPFSTSLIGEHWRHPISVVIYSSNLWVIVAIAYWRVTYVQKRKEIQIADADPHVLEYLSRSTRILFVFTSISFALSYVLPVWNLLVYVSAKIWLLIRGIKAPTDLR